MAVVKRQGSLGCAQGTAYMGGGCASRYVGVFGLSFDRMDGYHGVR